MQEIGELKTVIIVGAGAMGCLFAARLGESGASVTLVDVAKDRLDQLNRLGITLTDDQGTRNVPVNAALAGDIMNPPDLVMVFTKGMHTAAAVNSIAHLAHGKPVVVTLQNGIGNAEILAATFGAGRTVMGTAHLPADLVPPCGVVTGGFGHVHLGGFQPGENQLANKVGELLNNAGFDTAVTADAAAAMWTKVAFNAALNSLGMICERDNAGVNNPPGLRIADAVVAETVAVARSKNIDLDEAAIRSTVRAALSEHGEHKASMLQDRLAGRQTEVEMITGAVAREGLEQGVPTPVCSTLADLIRIIET